MTLDVNGERTRLDLYVQLPNGGPRAFIEVKTGPSAGLNANQRKAFPGIMAGGAVPQGVRAERAQLPVGQALGPTQVYVVNPWSAYPIGGWGP